MQNPYRARRSPRAPFLPPFLPPSLAFTCQIGALVGWASPATLLSAALSLAVFALCVAGLSQGALMWQYHRSTRRTLVLSQIVLSCAVEASTVLHKPTALAIAACKFAAFQFFAVFARYDAPRSSGLVVPGLWCGARARERRRRRSLPLRCALRCVWLTQADLVSVARVRCAGVTTTTSTCLRR